MVEGDGLDDAGQSRVLLDAMLESMPNGYCLLDRQLRYLRINSVLARLNDVPVEATLGRTVREVLPEPLASRTEALVGGVLATGEPLLNVELSRERIHALVSYYPVTQGGAVVAVGVSVVDITNRKRNEARLQVLAEVSRSFSEASNDYRRLVQHVAERVAELIGENCVVLLRSEDGTFLEPVAISMPDPELRARVVEGLTTMPLMLNEESLVTAALASPHATLYPRMDNVELRKILPRKHWSLLADTPIQGMIVAPMRVRGSVLGLLAISRVDPTLPLCDEHDRLLAEDLADRAALAIENARLFDREQRLRLEAERLNRVKDEFLMTLSHELRTPLTPILGWAQLLSSGALDAAGSSKAIHAIERNTLAEVQLVEDLLDASRMVTGNLRMEAAPVDVGVLVEDAVATVRLAAEAKGIVLGCTVERLTAPIWGDAKRLRQVLWNLLNNAVKFTPSGGHIELAIAREGSEAVIRVSDDGIGISPSFLPHVFDRFRQADSSSARAHGGLGLGLALVRQIVEGHGGRVVAESPGIGHGTTLTVHLPLRAVGPAAVEPNAEVPAAPASLSRRRILVVDDVADARDVITEALEKHGAEVRSAGSVAEALPLVESFRPELVIGDIGLPEEDGYALIRRVRALGPDRGGQIPAIALSAYAGERDRKEALTAGYQLHLAKPVDLRHLISAVVGAIRDAR